MKTANDLFIEFRGMCTAKGENKRVIIASILSELKINPANVGNPAEAITLIRAEIYRRLATEKGIVTGTKVTVEGKKGEFVVKGLDLLGNVRMAGLRATVSPVSVTKVG